jgi:hypothetical protein
MAEHLCIPVFIFGGFKCVLIDFWYGAPNYRKTPYTENCPSPKYSG